jgi:hypothetical protein
VQHRFGIIKEYADEPARPIRAKALEGSRAAFTLKAVGLS